MPRNLLLADDSATIRKAVEIAFAGEDFRVTGVGDGAEALRRALESRPDLVLADTAMPGLDGYALCQAIKSEPALAGVPVLLLAGSGDPVDETRAREAGADGHVTKPFDCATLVGRVNVALGDGPVVAPPPILRAVPPAPARSLRSVPPPLPPPDHPLRVAAARALARRRAGAAAIVAGRTPPPLPLRPPAVPPPPAIETNSPGAGLPGLADDDWSGVAPSAPEARLAPPPLEPPAALPAADGGEAALRLALSQASREVVEKIAWEVVPQLAEVIIREHVERLVDEKQKR